MKFRDREPPAHYARYLAGEKTLLLPEALVRTLILEQDGLVEPQAPAARPPEIKEEAPAKPPRARRRRGGILVFDPKNIAHATAAMENSRRDEKVTILKVLKDAARADGYRAVLRPRRAALTALGASLKATFPNFEATIERLVRELALQSVRSAGDFRMAPLLLYGAPGIGKTTFARVLAERLRVDFEVISAGSTQGAFEFSGTSRHWSSSQPGRIASLLARSGMACPIVVVDEVDKMGEDRQHPVLPALLDLLEEGSARRFRDACLDVTFDASRLVVLATANEPARVPKPLRSRMQEIKVSLPTVGERRQIVARMAECLVQGILRAKRPVLDPALLDALAGAPIDLREMHRRLHQAVGTAVLERRRSLTAADLPQVAGERRPKMGFV